MNETEREVEFRSKIDFIESPSALYQEYILLNQFQMRDWAFRILVGSINEARRRV